MVEIALSYLWTWFHFNSFLIKASLFGASAKMALDNRNEVLIKANKSRLLA